MPLLVLVKKNISSTFLKITAKSLKVRFTFSAISHKFIFSLKCATRNQHNVIMRKGLFISIYLHTKKDLNSAETSHNHYNKQAYPVKRLL